MSGLVHPQRTKTSSRRPESMRILVSMLDLDTHPIPEDKCLFVVDSELILVLGYPQEWQTGRSKDG